MKRKTIIALSISILLFVTLFFIALKVGRYNMPFDAFFQAIFTSNPTYDIERNVILNLRLPRTIVAGLSGIAICLSGLIYQETFQNKLVSPDLLGVSAGAGVGAALAIVLGFSSMAIGVFAFLIGTGSVLLTILISKIFRNKSSVMLLLSGMIVGGFMNATLSIVKYFADPETTLSSITYWLMGSFADCTMKDVITLSAVVIPCSIFLLFISWKINVIALGKEEAQSKGINYVLWRTMIIIIATLLTATSVSICGTISWIGLVIPHIVRLITGKNTKRSIPLTMTFGGLFMIVVDMFSRTFTPDEIPLSAVTGFLGTLIFVFILFINRRKFYER